MGHLLPGSIAEKRWLDVGDRRTDNAHHRCTVQKSWGMWKAPRLNVRVWGPIPGPSPPCLPDRAVTWRSRSSLQCSWPEKGIGLDLSTNAFQRATDPQPDFGAECLPPRIQRPLGRGTEYEGVHRVRNFGSVAIAGRFDAADEYVILPYVQDGGSSKPFPIGRGREMRTFFARIMATLGIFGSLAPAAATLADGSARLRADQKPAGNARSGTPCHAAI
jgi:hypothetical protein